MPEYSASFVNYKALKKVGTVTLLFQPCFVVLLLPFESPPLHPGLQHPDPGLQLRHAPLVLSHPEEARTGDIMQDSPRIGVALIPP